MLDAVFSLTTTYSKLTDAVYVAQVAELACVHAPDAGKSIRKLAELGIIVWVPGRGRKATSLIGVPAADEKRERLPLSFTESGKESGEGAKKRATGALLPRREQETEEKAKALAKSSLVIRKAAGRAKNSSAAARSTEQSSTERNMTEAVGSSAPSPASESESNDAGVAEAETATSTVATAEPRPPPKPATGSGDNEPAEPVTVPPELELALPAGLNRDVAELAASHYALTPLAVVNHAERAAATGDEPARYFSVSFRKAVANDELGELQVKLEHEAKAADRKPRETITGCRWVRGSHGSSHVQDPLGVDQPPRDWPHPPPTPAEILEARETGRSEPETREPAPPAPSKPAYDDDAVGFNEFTGAPPAFLTEPDADAEDHAGHAELDQQRREATERDET